MMPFGLETLLANPPAMLRNRRLGLLMNQASVDLRGRYACDVVNERFPKQLTALFSPQHGLWGEQQANMIESPHGHYDPLGLPVFSLYSETRQPMPEMLDSIDVLIVDLQGVGTRVYTFIWTVTNCLRACASANVPVVILDRPNPLGGEVCEGPLLEMDFASFVGLAPIPMRHGLTVGELARFVNQYFNIGADLSVIGIPNWRRQFMFPNSRRLWVAPSPNMPRFETAVVYPGQVLLEGTNLSEGRGTTIPFECVGAPFIDPFQLAEDLAGFPLPGVRFRPIRFLPTFEKWQGKSCGGVAWHVIDPAAVRSFVSTIAILACVRHRWPEHFQFLGPPYEYEQEKMPIDILYGSARLRERIVNASTRFSYDEISNLSALDLDKWRGMIEPARLYS